ncbi:SDR family NAD(P)-dependent oxidoreductase [Paenibacillus sp. MMS18-CY102]|uniref:SDR family NAD(P)-dependent oxidoreductase n=1 Tax=Paenibacillus sp. MMS18-CY102 TaxID=2682849 RepID=UPI001365E9C5|nr:SDR family NAD(P)-dependent oxidoreductase [Paenibacillus sp. MMS18-CY102]MWC28629.1 KR domain-containing protein [Paenibacillus sp. MMS18-CY102]
MEFGTVRLKGREKEEGLANVKRPASEGDIAIVGIGLQLPMAKTETELLKLLRDGTDAIRPLPGTRRSDTDRYFRAEGKDLSELAYGEAAYLEAIDRFDYSFFKLSPKEASLLDPNQRLFLETAWHAIEDAGMGGRRLEGSRTGVYVGYGSDSEYKRMIDKMEPEASSMALPGNVKPIIASRLSYLLDLRGPSLLVDTTCSSSLVAVHLACQAIRNGECDLAIAGGIQLHLLPVREFEVGIESSTGRTRTFDDAADGTGTGEGAVAIMLKPLSRALQDRDTVYAVIKGSAINQDGSSVGITAPNADAQADVIAEAWRKAGISPETVGYIETHGTGTKLGDPIELEGIRRAFARHTNRKMFCAVGSIKSNFGHLDNAAGITGLLKAALSLKHRQLFPTLHVERPNRAIPWVESAAYINTRLSPWEAGDSPLRCGVSSFGISGTNCHIVMEQAPAPTAAPSSEPSVRPYLLPFSARSEASLLELASRYADYLDAHPDARLADVCYTAAVGRGHYPYRIAIRGAGREEILVALRGLRQGAIGEPAAAASDANQQANEAIDRWRRNEGAEHDMVRELGRLYEAGADVNWEKLFQGRPVARLNLPATPFEQKRCWIHIPGDDSLAAKRDAEPDMYHRLEWREEPLPDRANAQSSAAPTIVAGANQALVAQAAAQLLAAGGHSVTEAVLFTPPIGSAADDSPAIEGYAAEFGRLLRPTAAGGLRRIALLVGGDAVGEQGLYAGAWQLLGLLRALASEEQKQPVELILAAAGAYCVDGKEVRTNPAAAALFAMGKAIHWEMPHIRARCVDYGYTANDVDGLVAALMSESADAAPYTTAWREGKRYIEQVSTLKNLPDGEANIAWRTDGVYLITGGLGGIGLRIAEQIAAKGAVRIALLNRSAFPPREAWEQIVSADGQSSDAHRIRAIQAIERTGAQVDVIAADTADERSLREALELLRHRYGRVNGIVHSAGSGDGNYLSQLTELEFEAFTAAKVRGAQLLDELTRADDPDFLILFSSAITLVGGIGSGPYAAGNAWQDAYASARRIEGGRVLSIAWPSWERTGLSAASETDERKELLRILQPDRGMEAFERLLSMPAAHVLVGEWNRDSVLFELGDMLPFRMGEALAASGKQAEEKPSKVVHAAPVKLKGKSEGASYSDVEQKVAQAWMAVLGYDELGVEDNFFELGGDSILIARLHERLQDSFPGQTKISDLFSHPTIAKLSAFLQAKNDASGEARSTAGSQKARIAGEATDIAIIGMTVRLPDAPDIDAFWENLIGGKESIRGYPEARQEDGCRFVDYYTDVPSEEVRFSHGGYLDRVDEFDPEFYGISPREASLMDPNQRLFLEACWEAIEDAGYGGGKIRSTKTGVYLGFADWPVYGQYINKKFPSLIHAAGAGNTPSLIASRIAYLLDLQGPAFLVDTACSSSLVAVHLACRSIRSGECDMAIAGGVKACLMPVEGVFEIGIESSHRQTRAFDDASDGTVWGEGTVALLLKPLEQAQADGDRVYAVIKGSAINQDGASAGITAPNAVAQEKVIAEAWEDAAIDPATVTYIETHGTGTKLGDPIEVDGIQRAFERYTDKKQFCAIGSVKSNIGHLDSAAGVAGLAKAVASLQRGQLAPTLHFDRPNRNIAFERSPVYVVDRPQDWETDGDPRRCGVSSFGFSGTNCHVVLEEAPQTQRAGRIEEEPDSWRMLALSGRSEEALRELVERYRTFMRTSVYSLDDICATANTGRGHYAHRLALIFRNRRELQEWLERFANYAAENDGGWPEGAYHGVHRVITGEREATEDSLLTVTAHRKLRTAAAELLDGLSSRLASEEEDSWRGLAQLYVSGADVDWEQLYEGKETRKVRVPTYPFQRKRHWLGPEPKPQAAAAATHAPVSQPAGLPMATVALKGLSPDNGDPLLVQLGQIWGNLIGISEMSVDDDFFELGGHSLLAIELERELVREGIEIDADDLYQHRTLTALARHIRASGGETAAGGKPIEPESTAQIASDKSPASPAAHEQQETPRKLARFEPAISALSAETLVLPGIEPFNDIFYRNCFFNSLFPAVRSFGRSISPFLANDLVVYEETDGINTAGYASVRTIEEVFALSGIRAVTEHGSENIVQELLESLSAGQPAVVWVDCYELPIRQDAYGKRHIDHTILVFGFDLRERLFHIVEHDRMENLSYRRRTLPFEDMARAFEGFVEQYVKTGVHEATHYKLASAPAPAELSADPSVQWARCWQDGQGQLAESLAALERIRSNYINVTATADTLQPHVSHLVAFLNEAALTKRVEIYRLHALLPEAEEEHALLDEILADWEYVRKGMVRYMYGDSFRQDTFESGADRIARIAEQERKLHQMISARLDKIAVQTN